jgi:hypothetical protein
LAGSLRQDSDHNGLDDAWERLFYGDTGVDPDGDTDGDQSTNGEEYAAGTNPRDALSRPPGAPDSERRILAGINPDGRFRFRLESDAGSEVVVEFSGDLQNWLPLPGTPQTLPDGSREWTDSDPMAGARYYRIRFPKVKWALSGGRSRCATRAGTAGSQPQSLSRSEPGLGVLRPLRSAIPPGPAVCQSSRVLPRPPSSILLTRPSQSVDRRPGPVVSSPSPTPP